MIFVRTSTYAYASENQHHAENFFLLASYKYGFITKFIPTCHSIESESTNVIARHIIDVDTAVVDIYYTPSELPKYLLTATTNSEDTSELVKQPCFQRFACIVATTKW